MLLVPAESPRAEPVLVEPALTVAELLPEVNLPEFAPVTVPPPVEAARDPDLAATAQLCTDFARVMEPGELPPLLKRAAQLLDAPGLVVWITDPAGDLRPAVAHGYSAQALTRMGSIPRGADNVTAAAYRSGRLRTIASDDMANGAVVAPIITPQGCAGVLSAEIRGGGEINERLQSVTAILAAQLATLVAPAVESARQVQA
jgi:hypothetical protein